MTHILLSAHQPVYLPWLGLLHKVDVADKFVIFDDVPYSRKMWYNRNKILGSNGPIMLSVPVVFSKNDETFHCDVLIDNSSNWQKKHWKSIQLCYSKAPFFKDYAPEFEAIYASEWQKLADLNEAILRSTMAFYGIETPLEKASSNNFKGAKSDRVLDMCVTLKADAYLFGALGQDYADTDNFIAAVVAPLFQAYEHPIYKQLGSGAFEPYMCSLDLLFNHGPKALEIMRSNNANRASYLADGNQLLKRSA